MVEIRLIRHGQTIGYHADLGLTDLGRQQAAAKAAELAGTLRPGEPVRIVHAPLVRAAETAGEIARGLVAAGFGLAGTDPTVDRRFDNFRLWCGNRALDPTEAYAVYAEALEGDRSSRPPWFDEMDQFWKILAAGEDPITYWLTQPTQHWEPAALAVRRFWHGMVGSARDAVPGLRLLVATHSGCIRAVAAAAFGYDPGEPENTEDVRIVLPVGGERGRLTYRGRTVEVVAPTTAAPPWVSDVTSHHQAEEPTPARL
ncbi:hypothetical protein BAY60_14790 [Prauserella muralis]|uniref:Phosphoglycerate mutase n=2 Tax=Prauserella muralis TaxID=588067 RepID=A0A2V4B3E0_9PSEU|nr:hypothetical protein BAY60_14790 [Prauserella muralis]